MATIEERPGARSPFTVRWREAGKHRRASYRTRAEARAAKAAKDLVEAQIRRGEYVPQTRVTMAEHAETWLEWKQTEGVVEHTVRTLRSVLDRWVLPAMGDLRLDVVSPDHLEDLLAEVTRAGKGNDTRVKVKGAVVGILDHAVRRRMRPAHALGMVRAGAPKRQRKVEPYTDAQLAALRAQLGTQDALILDVMGTMGLRPGEALSLRLGAFDGVELTVDASKTGQRRVLPVPDALSARLRDFVAERNGDPADPLFPRGETPLGSGGGAWTSEAWRQRVWAPSAEAAGVTGRPYDLRHTCASKLIARGASPADVAEWMGHSVKMTLEVYAHLFPGRKAELARLLD